MTAQQTTNKEKIIIVILILLFVVGSFALVNILIPDKLPNKSKDVMVGDLIINSDDLADIVEGMNYKEIKICSIETGKCGIINKIGMKFHSH